MDPRALPVQLAAPDLLDQRAEPVWRERQVLPDRQAEDRLDPRAQLEEQGLPGQRERPELLAQQVLLVVVRLGLRVQLAQVDLRGLPEQVPHLLHPLQKQQEPL